MKRFLLAAVPATALMLLIAGGTPALRSAGGTPAQPQANDDVQDFVFLTESRPLLVRLHIRVDGKPLPDAWDDFLKYLFAYLDVNGDGVLSKQEAERMPDPEQLTLGGIVLLAGGPMKKMMEELDTNKDGKATLDELKAYCRKKKFTPFQFQLELNPPDPLANAGLLGNYRPEPDIAVVSKTIFDLLDANKDGKLTRDELAAAQAILLEHDENEDEIVTTKELAPNAKPAGGMMAAMTRNAKGGNANLKGDRILVPILVRGEAPPDLARLMQERYSPSEKKILDSVQGNKPKTAPAAAMPKPPPPPKEATTPKAKPKTEAAKTKEPERKLTRAQLGLDEATFARLDADKDGTLDSKELAAFVKREPDLCLTLRFNDKVGKPLDLSASEGRPPLLADRVRYQLDNLVLFDLGKTRMELRQNEEQRKKNILTDIIRSQLTALFKAADKDGNGYVDEKEANASPQFRNIFKTLDREGKGKVSEKDMLAYFDKMQEIQKRAIDACVTLMLRDQSRGLFELLDANRDGWLGLRELRQAPKLLERVSGQGKDYLTRDDMPHSYLLTVHRGPSQSDALAAQEAVFDRLYGVPGDEAAATARGPAWFRKMDHNRDGDVSRKEFLFSDELFRKIDKDGDGLISVEEAEKAGAVAR
ncbi:MAG: EF-hand domain-containing protein [Gemmataceae bacterium]